MMAKIYNLYHKNAPNLNIVNVSVLPNLAGICEQEKRSSNDNTVFRTNEYRDISILYNDRLNKKINYLLFLHLFIKPHFFQRYKVSDRTIHFFSNLIIIGFFSSIFEKTHIRHPLIHLNYCQDWYWVFSGKLSDDIKIKFWYLI